MRFAYTLLLLCFFKATEAQNRTTDTSATCVAYWNKGDQKVFLINRSKEKTENGKILSQGKASYEAHLKVLDATAEGYTIEWTYKNFQSPLADAQTLQGVNALFEGMKVLYKTNEVGSFEELLNWKEVKDFAFKSIEQSLNRLPTDEAATAAMNQVKGMFQSKESIEAIMIKEIRLYHAPFGVEYDFRGQQTETLLPNFTGGKPFPANLVLKLNDQNPSKDYSVISINQHIDKGKAASLIADVLKKMAPDVDKQKPIEAKEFAALEINDESLYTITLSTGWLSKVKVTRTVHMGHTSNVETYEFLEIK